MKNFNEYKPMFLGVFFVGAILLTTFIAGAEPKEEYTWEKDVATNEYTLAND